MRKPERIEPGDLDRPRPDEVREVETVRHDVRQLSGKMEALRADYDSQLEEAERLRSSRDMLLTMLRTLETSRSWRVTRPLRWLARTVRERSAISHSDEPHEAPVPERHAIRQIAPAREIRPEDIVWIFGFGRSGSSWLWSLMTEGQDHQGWEEPLIGRLFGRFYEEWASDPHIDHRHFVLGGEGELWLASIRAFVLERIRTQFSPSDGNLVVVKEPNASEGAPLLMRALPESRMVLLVRDPRDVMASAADAHSEGGWAGLVLGDKLRTFDLRLCELYMKAMECSRRAYDTHRGPKVIVKYEQLVAEPLHTLEYVYEALEIALSHQEVVEAVEKHAWKNIPEDLKGPGKFWRKARPGSWTEDLSANQIAVIEDITAPILREFYSEA